MTPMEKSVRNFLIWLRDTDHCASAWLPECPKTEVRQVTKSDGSVVDEHWPIFTHFRVSGCGRQKTISAEVQELSRGFVDAATKVPNRMFYPNERGLKIAAGEVEGFLE